MSFRKKNDQCILPSDSTEKTVTVIYVYKPDIEDEMDQQELFTCAFSYINENEEYDVVCFKNDIWFGISTQCFTCIYIGFEKEDFSNETDAVKFVDTKKWKLNAGFMYLDNVYNKIIITSSASPEGLFKNRRWGEKIKTFKTVKLN